MPHTNPSTLHPNPSAAALPYNPALSLWLSVDPLSDNTHGVTPYAYCVNNPVRIIDPDGRDWFENEKTGDVYYSRDYHKGDEHLIDGEGWKWMGKNGMFGKSDHSVISEHFQQAEVFAGDDEISRASFSGENAKSFMDDMGYDFTPKEISVNVVERQQLWDVDQGGAPLYITNVSESQETISSTYVKKGTAISYTVAGRTPYVDERIGPYIRKTSWTENRRLSDCRNSRNDLRGIASKLISTTVELLKDVGNVVHDSNFRRRK